MKECRKDRQKRLIEVYDYLRQHFGIHTKTGFAEAVKYGRTSMSAAMNGKEEYLTDDLFENICDSFPDVFNLNYLLTGEGDLLTPHENAISSEIEQTPNQHKNNTAADMLELYAQRIRLVDDLRQSLKEELTEVRAIKEDMQTAVNDFRDATYRLTQALKSLNEQRPPSIGIAADDGDY